MRHIRTLLVALTAPLLIAVPANAATVHISKKKSNKRNTVTVLRDKSGIPHIYARDFFRLGVGEGTAFSEDNLCTLAEQFVTVNGQRSKFFGPNEQSPYYSAGVSDTNLKSDLYWQYVKKSGLVDNIAKKKPPVGPRPEIKQVYKGFVLGYNAYLKSKRFKDPRCKGKPWVRPITLRDMYLRGEQIATAGASAQFITNQVDAAPPAGSSPKTRSKPDFGALNEMLGDTETNGSNAIGLGNQATRNKTGMVLANPHFPWRGTERFWLAHLVVPGKYNAEGGTLEGFPLIGIGFNKDIAWTHTVSTARRFTVFQLKLAAGDPTSYVIDGKTYKMGRVTVSAGGQSHTFYTTRYGVVFVLPQAGFGWTNDTAYALGDSVKTDLTRTANQFLAMGQAKSAGQFLAVESKYLAIPTFTSTVADRTGKTAFADLGNVPNVPQSKIDSCIPSGLPQLVYQSARVITLDGSRGVCNWATDKNTPVKGIFNAAHQPKIIRRDWVENSNDSYWLANPLHPLTGFSPIIGLTGVQQGLRTRLGNEMIMQRLAGTDGYGKPKFDIPTLQRMWQNDRSLLAELVLADLVNGCQAHPTATASNGQTVDLTTACAALAQYHKTGNLDDRGGWLFSEWNRLTPAAGFWKDAFNPNQPLATPSQLNTDNEAIYRGLADAVQELQAHNVPLDAPYGEVQHTTRGSKKIPIHGCSTGCFNAINASNELATNPTAQAPYGEVYTGSSMVLTTELRKGGPVSQGILTYSQASDPTSRWFSNLTELYSKKKWVKLPYTTKQLRGTKFFSETDLVVK